MAKKKENVLVESIDGGQTVLDLDDFSWVKAGRNRADVLKALGDRVLTPRDLADATGVHYNSVSKVLRDFVDRGMAECLTPEAVRGRLYRLTRKGRNLRKNM